MTTIAWDTRHLAADTQVTGDFKTTGHSKLYRFRDGSIGAFAGSWGDIQAAQKTLDDPDGDPFFGDWTAIVIRPGGRVEQHEGAGGVLDITSIPFALGSGQAYALAAMACGKTAQEAIYIASTFDPFTGGPVEDVRATDVVPKKSVSRKTTRK